MILILLFYLSHVATPYYESSCHLRMIQEEQMKLKVMKESLAVAKPTQGSTSGSVQELSREMAIKDQSSIGNTESMCTVSPSGGKNILFSTLFV